MPNQLRVLVIQEDSIVKAILERFILSRGYSCVTISSLSEFQPDSHGTHFNVVITDLLFSDMGWQDFSMALRQQVTFEHGLVVSAMDQESIQKRVLNYPGVEGFFGMPLDFEGLEAKLKSF